MDQSPSDALLEEFDALYEAMKNEDRLNREAAERIRASFMANWGSW